MTPPYTAASFSGNPPLLFSNPPRHRRLHDSMENNDSTGGGFSDVYKAPLYQTDSTNTFKKLNTVPSKYFNQTGRGNAWDNLISRGAHHTAGSTFPLSLFLGFPDVSVVGVDFWIVYGGIPDEVGGTSASTPTFAGVVSLLNDARMAAVKELDTLLVVKRRKCCMLCAGKELSWLPEPNPLCPS